MKISTKLFNQQQVSRFGKLNEEIQSLQNKISTGKNIVQASDDPIGAVELSALQQVKERFSQYSKNADNAINTETHPEDLNKTLTVGYNIFGPISIFTGPIFQNIISIKSKSLNFGNYTNNFTMGLQIGSRIDFGKFGLGFRFERGFTDNEIEILGNNNIDIEAYSDIRPKLWSVSLTYMLSKKKDLEY